MQPLSRNYNQNTSPSLLDAEDDIFPHDSSLDGVDREPKISKENKPIRIIHTISKKQFDLLTEKEIEALSLEETKKRLKSAQITIIEQADDKKISDDKISAYEANYDRQTKELNKKNAEFEQLKKDAQEAIIDVSKTQSLSNLKEFQDNKQNLKAVEKKIIGCTFGRAVSLSMVIATLAVTIIFIIV